MNIARAVTYTSVPASDIHVLSYNLHTRSFVSNMVQRPANDQQRSKEGGFFFFGRVTGERGGADIAA